MYHVSKVEKTSKKFYENYGRLANLQMQIKPEWGIFGVRIYKFYAKYCFLFKKYFCEACNWNNLPILVRFLCGNFPQPPENGVPFYRALSTTCEASPGYWNTARRTYGRLWAAGKGASYSRLTGGASLQAHNSTFTSTITLSLSIPVIKEVRVGGRFPWPKQSLALDTDRTERVGGWSTKNIRPRGREISPAA